MGTEEVLCYGTLAAMIVFAMARSVQIWQWERDPVYQRDMKLVSDLNEIERLVKESGKYTKLAMESLDKFIAQAEKDGLIGKDNPELLDKED